MVPIRLVGPTGKMNPEFPLRYFTRCNQDNQTVATINYVVGLQGGGPSDRKLSNQQDFEIQQRNALAAFLISQGTDIQQCVKFIDHVVQGAGPGAVSSILGQKQPAKRWEGLIQLASALNIQVPDIMTRISKTKNKVQSRFQNLSRQLPKDIPADQLMLESGFLRNADGTPCSQISKIAPNSTGVVLISEEDAMPWLKEGAVISQDELAIVVIGGKGSCDNFDGQKTKFQCHTTTNP